MVCPSHSSLPQGTPRQLTDGNFSCVHPAQGAPLALSPGKTWLVTGSALLAQGTRAVTTLAQPASPISPARSGRSPTLEQFGVDLDHRC